jgi:probable rRNA maturation factor
MAKKSLPSPIELFSPRYAPPLSLSSINDIAVLIYRKEKIASVRRTHLIYCSDYSIRKLNRTYRKKDKPTDVLSFVFDDADLLGEIYISARRVGVQARRFGVTEKQEFLRLLIHGLLHLAGYDHIKPQEREIMEAREARYMDMVEGKNEELRIRN